MSKPTAILKSYEWLIVAVVVLVSTSLVQSQTSRLEPPPTRGTDQSDLLHGVDVADPYRWLESATDPAVQTWVERQNAYTRTHLDRFSERSVIKARLEELQFVTTTTAPTVVNGRYFFRRREGSQNHSVLYVRKGSYKADPKTLIDPNQFSEDGTVALDWTHISPDGSLIAYGKSANGDEKSTLYIKNVDTGEHLADTIPNTRYCGLAWAKDGKSFLYTRYPVPGTVAAGDENYNRRVYHHRLGDDWKNDKPVIEELVTKEEMVNPHGNSTHEWIFLTRSVDWTKNDLFFRPSDSDGPFKPIAVGLDAQVSADLVYGKLFIRTDYKAPRYRIMTADPKNPAPEHWKELIPQQRGVITALSVMDHKLVVSLRENACSRILIHDLTGKQIDEVKLPTLGSTSGVSGEWDDSEFFFSFSSYAFPSTVYRYDLRARKLEAIDKMKINIDPSRYETHQVWFKSKDGTDVPMFVVHKTGIQLDGSNPTLLYGYGGFKISMTPRFSSSLFVWLERGGVYAVANLRGGGEFGSEWHRAGRREKKQNVFDDFIAAAETLIELRYTNSERLAISGGSNGGLLVGATLVQRPELFRAVVCRVPLLDMLRYHLHSIARLWIPEYGSAEDPEQFKWLYAYSPYHQVKSGTAYPATLFMTATSDSRVDPSHAWKMAARLQANTSGDGPILLRTETKAGHGAGKPLSKRIESQLDSWVFLMNELGMLKPASHSED